MTDGTARLLELLGSAGMKKEILPRLIRYGTPFLSTATYSFPSAAAILPLHSHQGNG